MRQAGQGGQLPGGDVPGLRQPAGSGFGGQRAVSARELDLGSGPLCGGGDTCGAAELPLEACPELAEGTELALELPERALGLGHLKAGWVAGDDAFGMSPSFREALAALGMRYVLDVPGSTPVWPWEPSWTSPDYPDYPGFGRPRKPRLVEGQRRTMEQRSDELPEKVWREITGAQGSQGPREARGPGKPGAQGSQGPREARGPGKPGAQGSQGPREARGPGKPGAQGSQGPRSCMFGAQRVRVTRKGKPDQEAWAVYRRNLDGSEPRYYLSNAPEDTMLETLACVGGSRWPIETEFET